MPFELTKKASTFYNSESIIRIKQEPSAEPDNIEYSLSIWLRMKIVNTGLRSFTVDYISVDVSPIKSYTTYVSPLVLTKTQDKGTPANEKIELPVVIESGHSKYFLKKIEIPISRKIYFENKQTFKNINSKTLSPDENVCSILQNFNIISNITLAGGQTKSAKVKHCQGAVVAREIPYTK